MLKKILSRVNNIRIGGTSKLKPPTFYLRKYQPTRQDIEFIVSSRETIKNTISGEDKRLMVIIGPCSIHDVVAAKEYAQRLNKIKEELSDKLFILMRVYFEKPRTTVGWKGLINDPHLDNSFDIDYGLDIARHLLFDLTKMRLPIAVEYLDIITPQYFSDLIAWGAIGARTTESQVHRELASGISCPIGFKNGTDGGIKIAIDAVVSSSHAHTFLAVNKEGVLTRYETNGNSNCHVILRGGSMGPNYDEKSIKSVCKRLSEQNLPPRLMVDFSHDNSNKQHKNQLKVGDNIVTQLKANNNNIFGVMIESNLNEGNQKINTLNKLKYGVSITDACLGWDDSAKLLRNLADAI